MSKRSLSSRVRITLLKGMEAIGTSASNLASNAKLKVNEINLENRRREILTDFSLQAFELWQKGVALPGSLSAMLEELSDIENRLSVLRAQKYAKVPGSDNACDTASSPAQPDETGLAGDVPVSEPAQAACDSEAVPETPAIMTDDEEPAFTPQTIADDTLDSASPEDRQG